VEVIVEDKVITKWRPDTCSCEIDYEWERGSSEAIRVHTPIANKPCQYHAHLSDIEQHYQTVLKENQKKNSVIAKLSESTGENPTSFRFSFDEQRLLSVSHPKLGKFISATQLELDKEYGEGQVRLINA
jgi:hypothetical protein